MPGLHHKLLVVKGSEEFKQQKGSKRRSPEARNSLVYTLKCKLTCWAAKG